MCPNFVKFPLKLEFDPNKCLEDTFKIIKNESIILEFDWITHS